MKSAIFTALTVAGLASAKNMPQPNPNGERFAVLRFNEVMNEDGNNTYPWSGFMDPITDFGRPSKHWHGGEGSKGMHTSATGESLMQASCTSAKLSKDFSAYWFPTCWFEDPKDGSFEEVPPSYVNMYYRFESTTDDLHAFPVGLQILAGDKNKRTPPAGSMMQMDPTKPGFNHVQWTCPQKVHQRGFNAFMPGSDGTKAGMKDTNDYNGESGVGFPSKKCTGDYSPLRMDINFPSCYKKDKGLTDYKNNMAWPTDTPDGHKNCAEGEMHVPRLFMEVYFNTQLFNDRWEESEDGSQPFRLSQGDATGYGAHGDFIAGWDEDELQGIINGCNVGTLGMDQCPGVSTQEFVTCKQDEPFLGNLAKSIMSTAKFAMNSWSGPQSTLPGGLPVVGFGKDVVEDDHEEPVVSLPKPTKSVELPDLDLDNKKAAAPTGGAFMEVASEDEAEETVMEYVTVTETSTTYAEPTGAARRHAHAAHHARHGH